MEATALTIQTPAQPGRTKRIAAIATAITALVLAVTGAVALGANALRDGNGYFNWPTETFTSNGYAITMKTVDISHAPKWAFDKAGLDSVRVKATATAGCSSASPAPTISSDTSAALSTTTFRA